MNGKMRIDMVDVTNRLVSAFLSSSEMNVSLMQNRPEMFLNLIENFP